MRLNYRLATKTNDLVEGEKYLKFLTCQKENFSNATQLQSISSEIETAECHSKQKQERISQIKEEIETIQTRLYVYYESRKQEK